MKIFQAAAVFALFSVIGCQLTPMTAESLLEESRTAADPNGRAGKIKSYRTVINAKVKVPQLTTKSEALFMEPDFFRIATIIPGMPVSTVTYDGKECLRDDGVMGVTPIRGQEKEVMIYLMKFSAPNADWKKVCRKIELARNENGHPELFDVNGRDCYKLICHVPEELKLPPFSVYIDAADKLPRRIEFFMVYANAMVPMSTDMLEFRDCDGMKVASRTREHAALLEIESTLESIEFNVEAKPEDFRPKE